MYYVHATIPIDYVCFLCSVSTPYYSRLDVQIAERGESFYNPFLKEIVAELRTQNQLQESDGAQCVFLPGFTSKDGEGLPLIVQKTDGGFLYATTDLAAVRQRANSRADGGEGADRVLYVTDVGQQQHFQMVFAAARAAKLCSDSTELTHVPFGLVQGEDGKKFKTRSGDTVKLRDLLNEVTAMAGFLCI